MNEWSYNPVSPYAFMACRVASLIYISRNEGYNIRECVRILRLLEHIYVTFQLCRLYS